MVIDKSRQYHKKIVMQMEYKLLNNINENITNQKGGQTVVRTFDSVHRLAPDQVPNYVKPKTTEIDIYFFSAQSRSNGLAF